MRLRKLTVKGYRSIRGEENLVTDEKVTILIGANDHGKSNLLAAIHCLNDDHKIVADDRNWDLESGAPVEINWHFAPTATTIEQLKKLGPPSPPEDGSAVDEAAPLEPLAPSSPVTAVVPTLADTTAAMPPEASLSLPTFPISASGEIVLSRDIDTNEVKIVSLPVPVLATHGKAVLAMRPRIELFESPNGNVVDQVTRAQLETPTFEFMQGIFRLAGLWDSRETIFNQNDKTSRQLNEASAALTRILNGQWNQGKELKWRFEHTGRLRTPQSRAAIRRGL
jgi:hypothetical protein